MEENRRPAVDDQTAPAKNSRRDSQREKSARVLLIQCMVTLVWLLLLLAIRLIGGSRYAAWSSTFSRLMEDNTFVDGVVSAIAGQPDGEKETTGEAAGTSESVDTTAGTTSYVDE